LYVDAHPWQLWHVCVDSLTYRGGRLLVIISRLLARSCRVVLRLASDLALVVVVVILFDTQETVVLNRPRLFNRIRDQAISLR
jgi:hypothetical protein